MSEIVKREWIGLSMSLVGVAVLFAFLEKQYIDTYTEIVTFVNVLICLHVVINRRGIIVYVCIAVPIIVDLTMFNGIYFSTIRNTITFLASYIVTKKYLNRIILASIIKDIFGLFKCQIYMCLIVWAVGMIPEILDALIFDGMYYIAYYKNLFIYRTAVMVLHMIIFNKVIIEYLSNVKIDDKYFLV